MKKIVFILLLFAAYSEAFGKKVKFAVDMTGQTISANGVHVVGDFQAAACIGPDWDPTTALLSKEGTSNIYSIIVNIPAFKKYEYKFINGDQTYEAEFVPDESRVGTVNGDIIDNRWVYVDSLANDTTYPGAVLFAANAPAGKLLLRFKIDLTGSGAISANGVHVGTSYQGTAYTASQLRMYSFGNNVYDLQQYVAAGTVGYIFFNGNTTGNSETVPTGCAVNGKRSITLSRDTVLPALCFSACAACVGAGIQEQLASQLKLYPNPANGEVTLSLTTEATAVTVHDLHGKTVIALTASGETVIDLSSLSQGIYTVRAGSIYTKLIVE